MDFLRRSLMASGVFGLAAAAGSAVAADTSPASRTASGNAGGAKPMARETAARQVNNCFNRYTVLESLGRGPELLNEFALSMADVQVDAGFGLYYGPDGIEKFVAVNNLLVGDSSQHIYRNGATYLYANTTDIIEVAEDMNTAKGLWLTAAAVTPGSAGQGFSSRTGYMRRAVDFVNEKGHWKIWHYMVYGLISSPAGQGWTDPEVVAGNLRSHNDWIPQNLRPDRPSGFGVGPAASWRPDLPVMQIGVPVPYRTFSETFSYSATS
jgi:hypothetical protein